MEEREGGREGEACYCWRVKLGREKKHGQAIDRWIHGRRLSIVSYE